MLCGDRRIASINSMSSYRGVISPQWNPFIYKAMYRGYTVYIYIHNSIWGFPGGFFGICWTLRREHAALTFPSNSDQEGFLHVLHLFTIGNRNDS